MWLNGFNDNLPGFPRLPCKFVPVGTTVNQEDNVLNNPSQCRESYLGSQQPGVPLDPSKALQGPFGTVSS